MPLEPQTSLTLWHRCPARTVYYETVTMILGVTPFSQKSEKDGVLSPHVFFRLPR